MRAVILILVVSSIAFFLAAPDVRAGLDEEKFSGYSGRIVTDVMVSGNNVTKLYIIEREIEIQVGDTLNVDKIEDDFTRLENLGIFSSITITASKVGDDAVTLEYHVREMPWIIPYIKFKYTEQDGFSIGPTVSSVNMGGRAIYVTGYWIFGGTDQYSVELRWPWIGGNHISFEFIGANLQRTDHLNEFDEHSQEFTPQVGRYLGRNGRITAQASLFRMSSNVDGITLQSDNQDELRRLGGSIGFDNRDSWRDPHAGWWMEYNAVKTGGNLKGDGDWWLQEYDIRRFQPSFWGHTVTMGGLLSRQTGVVGSTIPQYMMYRLGGANTIRGYDVLDLGKRLFGRNQALVTVQYGVPVIPIREWKVWKWPISAGLSVAGFADFGTAWNAQSELSGGRIKSGFGLGLRFLVPAINVFRLDVAVSEEGNFAFHFGVWDKFTAQRLRIR
jgi:outer membrane protein assembly factor BamA